MPRSHPAQPADLPPGAQGNEITYEAALAELEQIVQRMEGGQLPLEESIAAYRRGSELLKHCQQRLAAAERKIQVLEDGALRDFDVASGAAQ